MRVSLGSDGPDCKLKLKSCSRLQQVILTEIVAYTLFPSDATQLA
jgi:hypothetical protein